ncbi:histidine--tRNA ligase [Hydrogenibacillus schlegelii]|nr:histidine--tRNA ligase [Hydrogenibacillus schlegelii]
MRYQAPRGTADILPDEAARWQAVEAAFREACRRFGYGEIRTPIFEQTELFARSVGASTDIVQKEMYTFTDRGGRSLTLRPEGTAPVVRAVIEHRLYGTAELPLKLCYLGPMFRYERPQSGRQRQFHQFGVEAIGVEAPELDAEVIALGWTFLQDIGLKGVTLVLNSLGCPVCRPAYREALVAFLRPHREALCPDCRLRLEQNPLRVLDCKIDGPTPLVASAPRITDHLCDACRAHHAAVKAELDRLGIPYVEDPHLVRGLDYYTRTVFEFVAEGLGAQNTVLAGGRYNGLMAALGGPDLPGIGFALGAERLLLLLDEPAEGRVGAPAPDVYVVAFGAGAEKKLSLLMRLRAAGLSADADFAGRGLKAQLRSADRRGARYAVIVGDDEARAGRAAIKHLATGAQWTVAEEELAAFLAGRIASPNEKEAGDGNDAHVGNHAPNP